ncbi:exodeoxyribonuclease V subunit gamma [Tsukamurella strandjordii]|uniref:RecBCD enzyme subunit RecC n=1 Tax=Tsukamurella strandjordii TaxID=147577 RepID=A0AA90N7V8_9ACTN|nr:exodeoxyribonuclease V subunit gamma [Tsukamurella strandjordii]MDP0397232.1 exodeoxyribonuclease V subunit gamma [Tsukamurella strandjordii]
MLTVHRCERGDVLVDALAEVLATPGADPFAAEVIAVPARGVERWITQRLASRLGIAANIEFPTPEGLVAEAVATASGIARDEDPWRGERLVWLVLAAIDRLAFEPGGEVLARHLGVTRPGGWAEQPGHRPRRRYLTAELLAGLLRSYGANRPGMLVDWAAGRESDGAGGALPADLHWQLRLFREVRDLAGVPSPAERLDAACERLRAEPGLLSLPQRLSVYGPTRVPADQAAVLAALARHRDVHLWLPHPSPALWERTVVDPASGVGEPIPRTRGAAATNPLLASLGRESSELQVRVSPLADADVHHPAPSHPGTLLGGLQRAIADDTAPAPDSAPDGTIEFHACHGPARMIEVLRERLVRLFEDDPTLQPRDVLVTCPDIETYAPLIRSAFGQAVAGTAAGEPAEDAHPAQRLRVRLADRSLRFTNPLLDALLTVLELADGRATVAQVLDLAATEPVRRRFRFSDSDIERLREWAGPSGARWGLDTSGRERFGLGGFPQNTLATALDRILLGVVADETEGEWLGLGLPLDDVDSTDIDLVGRFAEYLDVLTRATADSRGRRPAHEWAASLNALAVDVAAVAPSDGWQVTQAGREIATALRGGAERDLTLPEVRAMLGSRLAAKPTRANFRTGELTVCTLVPMRSVPHRVVVLLGLDDEVFPRSTRYSGDDVLGRTPCVGERDPRAEDRQLFLDAVTSATDRLLVFYTGADPVKGTPRPPAVPVAELRDAARALLTDPAASGLEFRHSLQPFDSDNFDPDRFGLGVPFSFDPAAYAGAVAAGGTPEPPAPFLDGPLAAAIEDVDLDSLLRFCEHPVKAFLRQRLGFTVPDQDEELAEALTIAPDGLQRWDIGDRMLASALAGVEPDRFAAAEMRRGTLPPFALGSAVLDGIAGTVAELSRVASPYLTGPATTVDIAVDLGAGRRLVGSVPSVRPGGIVRSSFSRLAPKHRVAAWVSLLALAAGGHSEQSAVAIGRGRFRGVLTSRLTVPADPVAELRALVDLRDRGLTEPLPLFPAASAVYAERGIAGDSQQMALDAARGEFESSFGDGKDRSIRYALGESAFDDALGPPRGTEAEFSRAGTRFGALAARLWVPLLNHEEMS